VQLGFVRNEPNLSTVWRARPLWSIVSAAGLPVGIVRWPLTYPAESVNGYIVSDRFHQLVGSLAEFDRAASPPDILPVLQQVFGELDPGAPVQAATPTTASADVPERAAMRRDRTYGLAARELGRRSDARFSALRYDGLDTVGHYYLSATAPRAFRDDPDAGHRTQLQAFDAYYAFVDGELEAAAGRIAGDDLLVVVSGFGMQPLDDVKRGIARLLGDPDFSGTHERAPDGFLLAYSASVEPGRRPRGSIVDVAPTLLYFLGLPVARDMDGFARADLFSRAFTAERPIVFIPSYSR
jgi:predicted AlkP superfamily phosphohydrolase/phosphomutase